MPFGLVIFDCDGVLVDSETPSNEALVANLARHGFTLSMQDAQAHFVGGRTNTMMAKAREMGAVLPDSWPDEIRADVFERLRQGVEPIAGVIAVLDQLDEKSIPYCVASNGSDEKMTITMGPSGLWDRFKGRCFPAKTHGVYKPDPRLFEIAAHTMGFAASGCVVIEDSPSGAKAARDAGMRCLGYAPHGPDPRLEALGARHFDDMRDLPQLLDLI